MLVNTTGIPDWLLLRRVVTNLGLPLLRPPAVILGLGHAVGNHRGQLLQDCQAGHGGKVPQGLEGQEEGLHGRRVNDGKGRGGGKSSEPTAVRAGQRGGTAAERGEITAIEGSFKLRDETM